MVYFILKEGIKIKNFEDTNNDRVNLREDLRFLVEQGFTKTTSIPV